MSAHGLLSLAASLALIIGLSALRVNAGFCILGGLLLFGLLVLGPGELAQALLRGLTDLRPGGVWDITINVALVAILGSIMRELGQVECLTRGLRGAGVRGRGLMALGPAIFGLLPVPGGAILSASMVEEEGRAMGAGKRGPAVANLLFRHINFFIYPLTPAIIFMASREMLDVSIYIFIAALLPSAAAHVISSYVASFHRLGASKAGSGGPKTEGRYREALTALAKGFTPIITAPILVALGLNMNLALCASIAVSLLLARPSAETGRKALRGLRRSRALAFSFPVLCAMLFRGVFKASDVPEAVRGLLGAIALPELVALYAFSMALGFATGSTTLAAVVMLPGGANMVEGVAAYTGAVVGYVISPLHLCFIVSAEYFGLRQAEMYPRLAAYAVLTTALSLTLITALAPLMG